MYALGQSYPIYFYMVEIYLNMIEQYPVSEEGDWHRLQLVQDPVTLINTNLIMGAGYVWEGLSEAILPVWRQGQRRVGGIYHPPQESLAGGPDTLP